LMEPGLTVCASYLHSTSQQHASGQYDKQQGLFRLTPPTNDLTEPGLTVCASYLRSTRQQHASSQHVMHQGLFRPTPQADDWQLQG
jgi:hypothetical protein